MAKRLKPVRIVERSVRRVSFRDSGGMDIDLELEDSLADLLADKISLAAKVDELESVADAHGVDFRSLRAAALGALQSDPTRSLVKEFVSAWARVVAKKVGAR